MNNSKVFFLKAYTAQEKLKLIQETAQTLFQSGKRFTLLAPSEEALRYLDQFLWNNPVESFLPHQISHRPTEEIVVLTTHADNLNQSIACINVSPSKVTGSFQEIYELLDYTTPAKQEQAELKLKMY